MSKKTTATERFEIRCLDAVAGKGTRPSLEELISLRNRLNCLGQTKCAERILWAFRITIKAGIISRTHSTAN